MGSTIRIAYSAPHARILKGGRLDRTLPSSWSEVHPLHVWPCIDMLMRAAPRRELVRILLDLPDVVYDQIDRGQMYDLITCIDWMQIDQESPIPIAPYYDHQGRDSITRLYLPGPRFNNVTGREYAMLDDSYNKFRPELDTDHEAQMIALVLRPAGESPDPASDPRIKLVSRAQSHEWLPVIRALPESFRIYMTTLISANRIFIHNSWGDWLFKSEGQAEGEESEEAQSAGLSFAWWGVFMDIAQDGVFGSFEQVLDTPIHTLCMYLSKKVDEARRLKQEHDHLLARQGRS